MTVVDAQDYVLFYLKYNKYKTKHTDGNIMHDLYIQLKGLKNNNKLLNIFFHGHTSNGKKYLPRQVNIFLMVMPEKPSTLFVWIRRVLQGLSLWDAQVCRLQSKRTIQVMEIPQHFLPNKILSIINHLAYLKGIINVYILNSIGEKNGKCNNIFFLHIIMQLYCGEKNAFY